MTTNEAQQAYQRNDFESMEKYLRLTLADFNSIHVYPAGIQLMDYLVDSGRIDDIFPIASYLQRNFPAFPEAYIVEARAWEKKGERQQGGTSLEPGVDLSSGKSQDDPVAQTFRNDRITIPNKGSLQRKRGGQPHGPESTISLTAVFIPPIVHLIKRHIII